MFTLILETSTEKGCLIVAENGVPIEVILLDSGPELSRTLGAKCEALISKCKAALQLVAVGIGPGSYTGIRVGVAMAKALAYGWRVPLLGFCSLKAFGPPPILVDAKKGGFYALLGDLPLLVQPSQLPVQIFSSPHPEIIRKRLVYPAQVIETGLNPEYLASLVFRQFLEEGAAPLELNYLISP